MRESRSNRMGWSWRILSLSKESLREHRGLANSILLVLLVCLAAGMTACDRAHAITPTTTSAANHGGVTLGASPAFPVFGDWRVAYVDGPGGQGDSGQLKAISLIEAARVAGPTLPGISPHYDLKTPAVSPNGHLVAIDNTRGLNIVELTGRHRMFTFASEEVYRSIAWSPDSMLLAVGGATWDGVDIIRVSDGSITKLPALADGTLLDTIGWTDHTHVVGDFFPSQARGLPTATPAHSDDNPSGVQTLTLATEDVITGEIRKVVSITSLTMGLGQFALSPDGKFALYSNRAFRDNPYVPDARVIDLSTGTVMALPHIAQSMGPYSGFTSIAWQNGTMMVAASSGLRANGDVRTWLLDLSHDSVQSLPYQAYVAGWAPAGGPLILTNERTDVTNGGPYQITAVQNVTDGHGLATVLTSNAYTFPFVGFVRTS